MESLLSVIKTLKLPKEIRRNLEIFYEIKKNWDKILGEKSKQAFPLYVEKGTLYIAVQDHYELQNLNSNYLMILQRINDLLKKTGVALSLQKLKFSYTPLLRRVKEREEVKEEYNIREIYDKSWDEVEVRLSMVEDIDLRESLRELLKSYRKFCGRSIEGKGLTKEKNKLTYGKK